ncbi:MAG: hypothetical protein WBD98_20535, partial [Acidobacteriaceae bacterium]
MKQEARAIDSWALIAVVILGIIFGTCALSAFGLKTASAQTPASWSQFQDPFEHAFALDVPQGWTVQGGLFRLGYSDERPMVDLRSPDGAIEIRLGDVAIPSYTVPNQFHAHEGEVYDLGAQARLIVARYRTGPEFAVLYSHARFGSDCRNPQDDAPDAGMTVPDYLPQEQNAAQSSAGQIAYRCETQSGTRVVFAYTRTALYQGIWQVPTIVSFVAPPEQAAVAKSIAVRCARSLAIAPEWIEYQKRMDAEGLQYQRMRQQGRIRDLQAQVQQFEQRMQAMQNQVNAFEQHQAAQAAQVQSFTNVLNGITPTTDPLTG